MVLNFFLIFQLFVFINSSISHCKLIANDKCKECSNGYYLTKRNFCRDCEETYTSVQCETNDFEYLYESNKCKCERGSSNNSSLLIEIIIPIVIFIVIIIIIIIIFRRRKKIKMEQMAAMQAAQAYGQYPGQYPVSVAPGAIPYGMEQYGVSPYSMNNVTNGVPYMQPNFQYEQVGDSQLSNIQNSQFRSNMNMNMNMNMNNLNPNTSEREKVLKKVKNK